MDINRFVNPAVKNAPPDESIITGKIADEMEANGIKLIHMDLGRPDFDSPPKVKARAIKAINEGKVFYTSLNGIHELKQAIAYYEENRHGLSVDPDKNVVVTVGASEALFQVWLNFLAPGDEILIPTPCYCSYIYMLTAMGIKVIEVPTVKNGEVHFNIEDFKSKLTSKTKMILINSPQNPTGMVYSHEQLNAISKFAVENDLLVISDECYDNYLFSGEHLSIATFPKMWERTITINSVSKTYSMTGWRVGYIVAPEAFINVIEVSHANLILCAPSFCQYGAAEALRMKKDELSESSKEFRRRRDCVVKWMDKIKLPYVKPEGAFYLFFDVSSLGMTGLEFSKGLLKNYHVTSMPGSIYGKDYKNYVRIAYTCSYEDLENGMQCIAEFVNNIKK